VDSGPIKVNEEQIFVTVSIGAAVTTHGGISDTEILAAADTALYRAKEIGRNRTVISDFVFH
jgi:diguanylate cyclase (GGDEF)-like protein